MAAIAQKFPDLSKRAREFLRILENAIGRMRRDCANEVSWCVPSGMVSSRLGWKELAYAGLPQKLDGSEVRWERYDFLSREDGQSVHAILVSGIQKEWDVMRGEEAQLIGL